MGKGFRAGHILAWHSECLFLYTRRTAAETDNDTVATAWLARCYFNGQGVEGQRLAKIALSDLTKRAILNDASALGDMYFKGVVKDRTIATSWFQKAAALGHAQAKHRHHLDQDSGH